MAGRAGLIVLGTAAVLAAAVPAAPYLTGLWAQSRFDGWVERLRASPAVEVHAARYQRQWGRARARTELTLHLPRQRLRLAIDHVVEHGPRPDLPALARITSVPEVPEPLRPLAGRLFADRPPLKAVTTLGLDGGQQVTVRSPPFDATLETDRPTRVHWQGVRLDLHKEDGRFRLDGRAPALAVATGPAGLRLEGVGLTSRFDERGDIWLGENRLRLARVAASGPVGFSVEGLQLRQHTSEPEPGRLRITSALDIDVLTPEGGPAYRRFGYTLTMDRLDRAAYLELARTAAELRRADAGAGLHPGPAAPDLSGPLRRLLARSPRLALERLTVFGPHGTAEASASLTFHGTPDLDLSAGPALLRRLEFEGRFRVPKGMLEALIAAGLRREAARRETDRYELPPPEQSARVEAATQRRLRTFEQAGFIEADGGDYTARARLADGRVTVNGRPLALGGGALPIPEP